MEKLKAKTSEVEAPEIDRAAAEEYAAKWQERLAHAKSRLENLCLIEDLEYGPGCAADRVEGILKDIDYAERHCKAACIVSAWVAEAWREHEAANKAEEG